MNTLPIIQSILAILVIGGILFQKRGAGLGGAIGGGGDSGFSTRRGSEKTLFNATIIFVILFFAVSIARLLI